MAVLDVGRVTIEPPAHLPISHLSVSSLRQLMMCPEKFHRRYILQQLEPPSGKMVLGSAAGASLAQHFGRRIEGAPGLTTEELLDEFSSEWDYRTGAEDVDFGADQPGKLKDSGAAALSIYHRLIAPSIEPVSVEREFSMTWGLDWDLVGFIDLEDAAGNVRDFKLTAKRLSQPAADGDLQATTYLAARRAEGNPAAGFCFDTLLRQAKPSAEVVTTHRSDRQLDALTDRVFALAREIEWRTESGVWSAGAAPGTWFCSTCRYADCPLRIS